MKMLRSLRNPVLERELGQQVQGYRPMVVVTVLVLFQAWILYVAYDRTQDDVVANFQGAVDLVSRGPVVFAVLVSVMIGWMTMVVPGLCASAIAGERERDTLLPLQITMMGPWGITLGKLFSSLSFIMLLIVASSPLLAVTYLMGGVALGDIWTAVAVILWTSFVWACLCLAVSALLQRTNVAMVTCYVMVFLIVVGSLIYYASRWRVSSDEAQGPGLLVVNPLAVAADVLGDPDADRFGLSDTSVFDNFAAELHGSNNWQPTVTAMTTDDIPDAFTGGPFVGAFDGGFGAGFGGFEPLPPNAIVTREVMPDGTIVESVEVSDAVESAVTMPVEPLADGDTGGAPVGDSAGGSDQSVPDGVPDTALEVDGSFDIDRWVLVEGSAVRVEQAKNMGLLPNGWEPGDAFSRNEDPARNFTRNALIVQAALAIASLALVAWRLRLPKEKIRL